MKKLQCELCDSIDIIKTAENLFQCQCCGCKYTLEQAKSLIRGTVIAKQPDFVIQAGKLVKYCGESPNVVVPTNVSIIGKSAFNGCSALNSVVIPSSVTTIEVGAFGGCSNLKSINIPESITTIDGYAFSGCKSLTEISIPNGITTIDFGVFYECSSLRKVNLPNNLTGIRANAFSGCHSLKEINIPSSVYAIDRDAFCGCSSLERVVLPNNTNLTWTDFSGTKWYVEELAKLERQRQMWKQQGLCPNCGGRYKGIFYRECTKCGHRDY